MSQFHFAALNRTGSNGQIKGFSPCTQSLFRLSLQSALLGSSAHVSLHGPVWLSCCCSSATSYWQHRPGGIPILTVQKKNNKKKSYLKMQWCCLKNVTLVTLMSLKLLCKAVQAALFKSILILSDVFVLGQFAGLSTDHSFYRSFPGWFC